MIDLEISEGVAFNTLNAPAARNALNNELAAQFVAACDEADRDPSVGAAVIRGAGLPPSSSLQRLRRVTVRKATIGGFSTILGPCRPHGRTVLHRPEGLLR